MILIGLTGGMGSGKSTVTPWIEALGWQVIDADHLARLVLAPGTPGLGEVVLLLGEQVLDPAGSLKRAEVARLVFQDRPLLKQFERIVHGHIRVEKAACLRTLVSNDLNAKVVYAAPLMFETHLQSSVQKTVLIDLAPETQLKRLTETRKMPLEDIKRRIANQMPLEEKRKLADFVINNNGPLETTKIHVERLFAQLAELPPWSLEQVLRP